jgi:hypothetical protein
MDLIVNKRILAALGKTTCPLDVYILKGSLGAFWIAGFYLDDCDKKLHYTE